MGGIVGRLFREFAVTLSAAIFVSMLDLADRDADDVRELLKPHDEERHGATLSRQRARVRLGARAATQPRCAGCCAISR